VTAFDALVLDFDGVVVESVELKDRAFGELFRDTHPDRVEDIVQFQSEIAGRSRYERFPLIYGYLGLAFPDGESERLDRKLSELLFEAVATCPFVAGARELLELRSGEVPIYVASATPENEVRRLIEARGLSPYIRAAYGAPARKADNLRRIATETGADPTRVLFVGDSATDLRAAEEAGVRFVGRVAPGLTSPFPDDTEIVTDLSELDVKVTQCASS
jgi:phosphoglycolate phosphatase-like HAD superfamily hydrolase